jgi:hypothetical protein
VLDHGVHKREEDREREPTHRVSPTLRGKVLDGRTYGSQTRVKLRRNMTRLSSGVGLSTSRISAVAETSSLASVCTPEAARSSGARSLLGVCWSAEDMAVFALACDRDGRKSRWRPSVGEHEGWLGENLGSPSTPAAQSQGAASHSDVFCFRPDSDRVRDPHETCSHHRERSYMKALLRLSAKQA